MAEQRLVVGFDGSHGARSALRWALEVGLFEGSPVEAVGAWAVPVTPVSPWATAPTFDEDDLLEAFESELRAAVEAVRRDVLGAPDVELRVVPGFAATALLDAARGARMLVVGRRGHGGFVGLLLGSVADHCLHHSTVPLALVPPEGAATDGDVVVGVDGSACAAGALRFAVTQADRLGRRLVALHAWSWLAQPDAFDVGFDQEAATAYTAGIVRAVLGDRPVDVVAVNDLPARALIDRSAKGDLVVVGSRGENALKQALVGSVSRQLAHHAPATVIVVRSPH